MAVNRSAKREINSGSVVSSGPGPMGQGDTHGAGSRRREIIRRLFRSRVSRSGLNGGRSEGLARAHWTGSGGRRVRLMVGQ